MEAAGSVEPNTVPINLSEKLLGGPCITAGETKAPGVLGQEACEPRAARATPSCLNEQHVPLTHFASRVPISDGPESGGHVLLKTRGFSPKRWGDRSEP